VTPVRSVEVTGRTFHTEWFGGTGSIDVQMSRHRFVYANCPAKADTWAAIQREYAVISARLDAAERGYA
jgi:hypothetical protein